MKVTLKDIAREAGVSIHAVSDILGGDMRYNEKTRKHVKEAADRLGYRPNRQARVLRGAKSNMIGMINTASVIQTNLERALFAGEAIHDAKYDLITYNVHWYHDGLAQAVDALIDHRAEGVLIAGMQASDFSLPAFKRLLQSGIPIVTMAGGSLFECSYVTANFEQGGRLQAEHCLKLGFRTPVIISGEGDCKYESVQKRIKGALDVYQGAGIKLKVVEGKRDAEMQNRRPLEGSYMPGYEAMSRILRQQHRPDVVVCINDYMAISAIQACHDHGISVPDELAVIGFDDTTAGKYSLPPLTTVQQPTREIALRAVEVLVEEIRHKDKTPMPPQKIEMDCHLVVRESCGARRRKPSFSSSNT